MKLTVYRIDGRPRPTQFQRRRMAVIELNFPDILQQVIDAARNPHPVSRCARRIHPRRSKRASLKFVSHTISFNLLLLLCLLDKPQICIEW